MRTQLWRATLAAFGLALTAFAVHTILYTRFVPLGHFVPVLLAGCGVLVVVLAVTGWARLCDLLTVALCVLFTARGASYMALAVQEDDWQLLTQTFGAWTFAPLTVLALTATRRVLDQHPRWHP